MYRKLSFSIASLRIGLRETLSSWLNALCLAAVAFVIAGLFGWKLCVALHQNVGLHGVVSWYGNGIGSLIQWDAMSLLAFVISSFLLGSGCLLAAWYYNHHLGRE